MTAAAAAPPRRGRGGNAPLPLARQRTPAAIILPTLLLLAVATNTARLLSKSSGVFVDLPVGGDLDLPLFGLEGGAITTTAEGAGVATGSSVVPAEQSTADEDPTSGRIRPLSSDNSTISIDAANTVSTTALSSDVVADAGAGVAGSVVQSTTTTTLPGCELVIAHYTEDLTWTSDLCPPCSVTVYHKGDYTTDAEILSQLTNRSSSSRASRGGKVTLIRLPNRGREGETWLQHIIRRYDTLSANTILIQGGIHLANKGLRGVTKEDIERACYLGLVPPHSNSTSAAAAADVATPAAAPPHPGVQPLGNFKVTLKRSSKYAEPYATWVATPLRQTMSELWGPTYQPKTIEFYASAQMALSPSAIRFHPRRSYEILEERLLRGNERIGDGYSGYILERLWHVLFDGEHAMTIDEMKETLVKRKKKALPHFAAKRRREGTTTTKEGNKWEKVVGRGE